MINWNAFTLLLLILMRMSGFILFNPILGRSGVPNLFKAGFIFSLTLFIYSTYDDYSWVTVPQTTLELAVIMLLELSTGIMISVIMNIFFMIPEQAGSMIDTQMGMSMARTYDTTSQSNSTVNATFLRLMMMTLFFVANGHITLIRIMITSGELVPYGTASLGEAAANRVIELFVNCMILAVKLCFPVLAAELLGQVGMGVLMKAIPQINVFAINIELKIIIGLVVLVLMLAPISNFMLEIESGMLREIELALDLAHG